jgi:hypothetical protein
MDTQTETFAAGRGTLERLCAGDFAEFALTIDGTTVTFSYATPIPQWGEDERERETHWGTMFELAETTHAIQIDALGDRCYTVFAYSHNHKRLLNKYTFNVEADSTDDAILDATVNFIRNF